MAKGVGKFQIESKFAPSGDQPTAIAGLVEGLRQGERIQTLLGATGTGKNFRGGEHYPAGATPYPRYRAQQDACGATLLRVP